MNTQDPEVIPPQDFQHFHISTQTNASVCFHCIEIPPKKHHPHT